MGIAARYLQVDSYCNLYPPSPFSVYGKNADFCCKNLNFGRCPPFAHLKRADIVICLLSVLYPARSPSRQSAPPLGSASPLECLCSVFELRSRHSQGLSCAVGFLPFVGPRLLTGNLRVWNPSPQASHPVLAFTVLFQNLRYYSGAYRSSTFSDCKSQSLFDCYRCDQVYLHRYVISRHAHLCSFR